MAAHQVRALLMGGQACVFYGAAEFSRDTDLLILADPGNLQRLDSALKDLHAKRVAVPPFSAEYLERGHAVHFRCEHPEAAGMRVDVMSKLRGVEAFAALWDRRTTLTDEDGMIYELLSLPDLVLAKKTQRSKDWPMVRRLMEASYLAHRDSPTEEQARFWLMELRTPELLRELIHQVPALAERMSASRPLLRLAGRPQTDDCENALAEEERREREADKIYWKPLKAELEKLRHADLHS